MDSMANTQNLTGWLDYISQQHTEVIDMGLERFNQVLDRMQLHNPAPAVITVAGTNGKGTTCRMIEALLLQGGYRVGSTLSPHIWRFNERIRLHGRNADDEEICAAFAAIDLARGDIALTYFEFSALAALYCMAQAQVDVAILEIGLGGRLDAFNAIDPDVAVITSIGLDHQVFLGDTREAIGVEKAGILRSGQHVVLGQDMPESVLQRCDALALKPRCWGVDFSSSIDIDQGTWQLIRQDQASLEIPLTAIAPHNIALACEAVADMVDLNLDLIARCSALDMPGRMDIRRTKDRMWILDVCHNPDGARFFLNELASRKLRPAYFVCAMLAGKDHRGFYQSVIDSVGNDVPWLFVDSHGDRQMTAHALVETLCEDKETAENTQQALTMARERTHTGEVIVIFGSFSAVEQCAWLA
jgi:dihydrofolate synthase/folylpolyglutamate synthase